MLGYNNDNASYLSFNRRVKRTALGAHRVKRSGATTRLAAALLAVVAAAACGGGGASSRRVQVGAKISTGSLTFASQAVGSTSAAQTVTVMSTGILDLAFTAVTINGANAGEFHKSADTCSSAAILPNSSCTVNIAFAPAAIGARSATLQFNDNASSSPQTVSLSGTGTGSGVSLSSPGLDFGGQPVGSATAALTETVTNNGNADLIISTVTITGANAPAFTKSADTCSGATIAASASCAVSVTFTPPTGGTLSAVLNFADNAADSPQAVPLSGIGTAPVASIAPASLDFSDQNLGTVSTASAITLTNIGGANLVVSAVTLGGTNSGEFSKVGDTCVGATLVPNTSCSVSLTFAPAAAGLRTASVTISDNTSNSPHEIGVTGVGTVPVAGLSTGVITFSHQGQGTTSAAQAVIINNVGTGKLNVSSATIGGPNATVFTKSIDTCTGATVTTTTSCTLGVTFTPSSTATFNASLTIADNTSTSPHTVSLTGTGTASVVGLAPPGLAFGSQDVGTTSATQSVTVTNTGNANLAISTVAIAGTNIADFAKYSDTCTGAVVMPAAQCTVTLTFSPAAGGSRSASLNFADDAPSNSQSVSLGGTGVVPAFVLAPRRAAVAVGGTLQFSAANGGVATSAVSWSVNGTPGGSAAVGTIDANGLYAAPTVSAAQSVTVQATLNSDTSVVAGAAVSIIPTGTVTATGNPLVASYALNVPEASLVSVEFGPDTSYGFRTSPKTVPSGGGPVQILVAGMLSATPYHMRAVVKFLDGTEFDDLDQVFTTGALQASQIPAITVTTTPGLTPNPGIEMLALLSTSPAVTAENVVATDLGGNVIWYFDPGHASYTPNPIKLLPNGNVLLQFDTLGTD